MGSSWEPSSSSSVSWPSSYPSPSPMRRRRSSRSPEVQRCRRRPRPPFLPPARGQRRRRRRSGRRGSPRLWPWGQPSWEPVSCFLSHTVSVLGSGPEEIEAPSDHRDLNRGRQAPLCRPLLPLPSLCGTGRLREHTLPRRVPKPGQAHRASSGLVTPHCGVVI